jgi:hypothetical protein
MIPSTDCGEHVRDGRRMRADGARRGARLAPPAVVAERCRAVEAAREFVDTPVVA